MNNTTNSNYGYGSDASLQPMREEVSFAVPASKCGVRIFCFEILLNKLMRKGVGKATENLMLSFD